MIERLKQYANAKGITYTQMEKDLGRGRGYLCIVKNMSTDVLEEACRVYPDISCEWIVRGTGPMCLGDAAEENDKRVELLMAKLEKANSRITNLEIELELNNA